MSSPRVRGCDSEAVRRLTVLQQHPAADAAETDASRAHSHWYSGRHGCPTRATNAHREHLAVCRRWLAEAIRKGRWI
jgi:hypothetical protein